MKVLSPMAQRLIGALAQDEGRRSGVNQLYPEHVILALLKSAKGIGYYVFKEFKLNTDKLIQELEGNFRYDMPSSDYEDLEPGRRFLKMQDIADIESNAFHNDYIGTEHFLLAAIREEESATSKFFYRYGISISDVRKKIHTLQMMDLSSTKTKMDVSDSLFINLLEKTADINIFAELDKEKRRKQKEAEEKNQKDKKQKSDRNAFLDRYARDITQKAIEGKCDPIVGREKEIARLIQILLRRNKNNPVLTGEPGVGKTAIVEGLAQKIVAGLVPQDLAKKRILSLDMAAIVAGTKFRGEFEERMKNIMNEIQNDADIILFIDELHTIIGAGSPEGTMDASNILKPALSRGEIQIIGATTTKEYSRYIEKDLALERRFQNILVDEPGDDDSIKILSGIKSRYEEFHKVVYSEDVIPHIIKLSKRYLPERVLPDKAIDILDEAGSAKKIETREKNENLEAIEDKIRILQKEKQRLLAESDYDNAAKILENVITLKKELSEAVDSVSDGSGQALVTIEDISKIVSEMTGIPLSQMDDAVTERLINMESLMEESIIGQSHAVKAVSSVVRRSRAGISSPKRPAGSFIFLGPTGVGKTELAKTLAKFLFGSEDALIRIDMSDFMEKHTASRLVGSPPGYVGYEEGGVLTEKVRHHPYSVVLLDEIEKAHPDIFNLLLQMLEEGELSDNLGHTVNFRNCIIIMTSNIGSVEFTNTGRAGFIQGNGEIPYNEIKANAINELKKIVRPEFLNRIDDVVVFKSLGKEEMKSILHLQVSDLSKRLLERNLEIKMTESAEDYLIEKGYEPAMGARPLRRLIQNEIEDTLALKLLLNRNIKKGLVLVDFQADELSVELKDSENYLLTSDILPQVIPQRSRT